MASHRRPSRPDGVHSDSGHRASDGVSHDDFWGDGADWTDRRPRPVRPDARRRLGDLWSNTITTGATPRRQHGDPTGSVPVTAAQSAVTPPLGRPRPDTESTFESFSDDAYDWDVDTWDDEPVRPAATARQAAPMRTHAGRPANDPVSVDDGHDDWDAGWLVEPVRQQRSGAIDPLLARLGVVLVALTLAVPLLLGLGARRDGGDELGDQLDGVTATAGSLTEQLTIVSVEPADTFDVATAAPPPDVAAAPATASNTAATDAPPATAAATSAAPTTTGAETNALTATTAPAPRCGAEYEIVSGDYWLRLADEAEVPMADLLAVNGATTDTVLIPGRTICLPTGALTPSPPPTTAAPATTSPPSTARPATTAPATTAPSNTRPATPTPTTTKPATAAPPTTARPTPPAPAEVEAIIRAVWPDDLEDQALRIAWRESNYRADARNSCCHGLFQIHWSAHRSWLRTAGVTAVDQLYDATVNAQIAYALYVRAGGFGPWGG